METSLDKLKELQTMLRTPPEIEILDYSSSSEEDNLDEEIDSESDLEMEDFVVKPTAKSDIETCSLPSTTEQEGQTASTNENEDMYKARDYVNDRWWSKNPSQRTEVNEAQAKINVLDTTLCGKGPLEVWSRLFTDAMLLLIVKFTNEKIIERMKTDQINYPSVDLSELKAFIGLLYYCGAIQETLSPLHSFWKPWAPIIFRVTMKERRFIFLLQCLTFNNKDEAHPDDLLGRIRPLLDLFLYNCKRHYSPGRDVTINEVILDFHGKCPFRVNKCNKSNKQGLKLVMMNDAMTRYMINMIPQVQSPNMMEEISDVHEVTEPIHGSYRNIACGKAFTTVYTIQSLQTLYSLNAVGIIRHNEYEIPKIMKDANPPTIYSDNMTLFSRRSKSGKAVLMLSSLSRLTTKDEITEFYKSKDSATKQFDALCRVFTTARPTNRWTTRFFFGMLDQSAVNSCILHNLAHEQNYDMKNFIITLAVELVMPYISSRLVECQLSDLLRFQMEKIFDVECQIQFNPKHYTSNELKCDLCGGEDGNRCKYICVECEMHICDNHRTEMCVDCI